MTINGESPAEGLTAFLSGADDATMTEDAVTADWTSSPWTLLALLAVGCLALTALIALVIPVATDLLFGWIPALTGLVS
jgi:hypothetical protein